MVIAAAYSAHNQRPWGCALAQVSQRGLSNLTCGPPVVILLLCAAHDNIFARRKGSGCHDCLADRPYPVCNWPTIGNGLNRLSPGDPHSACPQHTACSSPQCQLPDDAGLLLVTLLLAAALAARELSSPRISHTGPDANLDTGAEGDAFTSPEGIWYPSITI